MSGEDKDEIRRTLNNIQNNIDFLNRKYPYLEIELEEKKAIENLKEINQAIKYRPMFSIPSDTKLFDTILNLIEKQTKEIEELNKSDESKEQSSMKYYNLYKELVDKIKAKIEEYKKLSNNVTMQPQIYPYIIEVLQSLLEKE